MRRIVHLFFLLSCAGCANERPTDVRAAAPQAANAVSADASSAPDGAPHDASVASASTTLAAPITVSIVVDQMAAWIASERWPLLPNDGGFARLRREGTYVREMRYAHAVTDTAPGHSALYTGSPPRGSGIFGNETIDAAGQSRVSIVRDEHTSLVTGESGDAGAPRIGSSAARLATDTVADRFRARYDDAIIVSVSLKDRGAIFGGGRRPTASMWFERSIDRFVTSTAFRSTYPTWAHDHASPAALRKEPWTLLDPEWTRAHAATPDDQAGEGDLDGLGVTFPHAVAKAAVPPNAFRATPYADDAVLALALAALDGEAVRAHPTLLALSLSANDYVGHTFGPDSWEAWDELRRLDASLGRFFAALDARFGPNGWSAILSADHGVTTMPEATRVPATRPWCAAKTPDRWERPCGPAGRILPDALAQELRGVADAALGKGAWVHGVADPYVFLTPDTNALPEARRKKLVAALVRALAHHPEVDRVVETRSLPTTCPPESDASIDALVCRAFAPGGGELYVLPKAGSFFDPSVVVGKGTSHGSPYLFDRAVPLLARAPGRIDAGVVVDAPLTFRAFAATLASLLRTDPPDAARDARTLVTHPDKNATPGARP